MGAHQAFAENMNPILLTKIFPAALTVVLLVLLFFPPEETGPRFWIIVVVLFAVDGMIFTWQRFRKTPNLKITEDAVFVCGLKIDRRDIQGWRVFRTIKSGERGRFIEIQLKRIPPSPFGWKLAKLFEQVSAPRKGERGRVLAQEPRIIAALSSWDLTKDEISNALDKLENKTEHPTVDSALL